MRFFFMGSVPNHIPGSDQPPSPDADTLFAAAKELGYRAALRKHTVLLGSDSPRTIDYYVAQGVYACCAEHPDSEFSLEVHCPEGGDLPYSDHPANLSVEVLTYPGAEGPNRWMIAHMRMMDSCDAIITLGGGESTRTVGLLAAERGKPYLIPIASFGGASLDLLNQVRYTYRRYKTVTDKKVLTYLSAHWSKDNAERIIGLTETFVDTGFDRPPAIYFISYSRADMALADEIELFLRRAGRNVIRDEVEIVTGTSISNTIEEKLNQADVLIALVNQNYKDSTWCMGEFSYAMNRKRAGKTPNRVVSIVIQPGFQVPVQMADTLYRVALSRLEREMAIMKVIGEEA